MAIFHCYVSSPEGIDYLWYRYDNYTYYIGINDVFTRIDMTDNMF